MITCQHCGHENPPNVEFCLACAASLRPTCPACGQLANPGDRFCGQCGADLGQPRLCTNCGHPVPPGNRFCGQCGTPVDAPRPKLASPGSASVSPPAQPSLDSRLQSLRDLIPANLADKMAQAAVGIQGERREVTVLFLDATNFTAVSHFLDSEDVYLVVDEAMRLLVEVIYKYEGTVDKFTGDGLMALFGAPVAHENDPERAVRAALEMQAVLQPLRERTKARYGFDFQVRIGINTGLVVAGRLGNDLHMEYTVIGDTVNLASRLETAAEPGTVLVSFSTYQRTRPLFDYQILPPIRVKGKPEPIQAYRPLGVRKRAGQVRGLPGLQVPMVGRRDLLAQLEEAAENVERKGRSQIVLVTGDAGLGKSRLVNEFRKQLLPPHFNVYEGQCLSFARSTPLWILASLLRDILGIADTDPAALQREKLQAYLQQLGEDALGYFPYLVSVLGLEHADPGVEAVVEQQDVATLQRQIYAAFKQVLIAEAQRAPTVYIFEDLHWVDPASRSFLVDFLGMLFDLPVLVILVSRDFERETVMAPILTLLQKHPAMAADIRLQALSKSEELQLIEELLKKVGANVGNLARRIAERTEGNPFYIEEIIRMLLDQGELPLGSGQEVSVEPLESQLDAVPGTLKGLILTRFDSLPENLRLLLQKAAVIGRSFPVRLVQELSGVPVAEVAVALQELTRRQFLVVEPFGEEQGYSFRHALIQEAIYHTLLRKDRRRFHDRVARVIQDGSYLPRDEQIEALAYHYSRGEEPTQAIPYLLTTAENALRRSAYETAIQHFRRILALMEKEREGFLEECFRAHIGLGQALKFSGEFQEAEQVLQASLQRFQDMETIPPEYMAFYLENLRELADVGQRTGELEKAVQYLRTALDAADPQEHPALWYALLDRFAWVRFRQGRLDEAFQIARNATQEVEEQGVDLPYTLLGSLYNTLGGIAYQQGNPAEAIPYVESSLHLYEEQGYAWGIGVAYANLGVLHWALGNWPKAAEMYERAANLQSAKGFVPEQITNLRNLGHLRRAMGDHAQARQDIEKTIEISQRFGYEYGILCGEVALALLALTEEDWDELERRLDAAKQRIAMADQDHRIQLLWMRAWLESERGNLEKAIQVAQDALELAQETGMQEELIDCHRTLGRIHALQDRFVDAEQELRRSIALAQQRKDALREGQGWLELARLYQQAIREENPEKWEWHRHAQQAAEQATELFQALGAAYELRRAQHLLAELKRLSPVSSPDHPLWRRTQLDRRLPEGEKHRAVVLCLELRTLDTSADAPPNQDDEAILEQLARLLPSLVQMGQEKGASVIRRNEGLTLVFGAPISHEDDFTLAVETAWEMTQVLDEIQEQERLHITFAGGISAGEVVGGYLDPGSQRKFVVTGPPVQYAMAIAAAAAPGQIWVSQSVRSETEHAFLFDSIPKEASPGIDGFPISVLTGRRSDPQEKRGLSGLQAPLVGRQEQLEAMLALAARLEDGQGGLIWLEGEAGIGKSRLLREFAARFADQGIPVWSGQCSPQAARQAFSLFTNLLENVFSLSHTDSSQQKREKIRAQLAQWFPDPGPIAPHLEILCGVLPEESHAQQLATMEPEQLRQQLFVALRTLLNRVARDTGLIVLLDDLHWIDPLSAQLLLFLVYAIQDTPILLVGARRPAAGQDEHLELTQVRELYPQRTVTLQLERLNLAESAELLQGLLSGGALAPSVRNFVLNRSEGNPFYIEEFLRLLLERGYLEDQDGKWSLRPGLDLDTLPLPTSLEALIRSRVDNLPLPLRQQLQLAAIIGRPFKSDLLAVIGERPDVEQLLCQAAEQGILRLSPETEQWAFSHNLAQAVVYEGMLKVQRKALHRRVAEALQSYWAGSEEEHAAELAHHFALAGENRKALGYLIIAGEQAAAHDANQEALEHFQQADAILGSLPGADCCLRWRVIQGLGDVHRFLGHYTESLQALERGLSLIQCSDISPLLQAGLYRRMGETARRQGAPELAYDYYRQALVRLEEPEDVPGQLEAARTLLGLAWTHFYRGQLEKARETSELSHHYAELAQGLNELAAAENLLGGIYFQMGETAQAMEHTAKALAWREEMGYSWGVAATLSNLGVLAMADGDWKQAAAYFQQSLERRMELGDMEGVAIVHNNLGWLAVDRGELTEAAHHFQQSFQVAGPAKMTYHSANAQLGLAQVHFLQGDSQAAEGCLRESLELAQRADAKDLVSEIRRLQAEIHLAHAQIAQAQKTAWEAVHLAQETGSPGLTAAAWRILSECQLRQGDLAGAQHSLAQAQTALARAVNALENARLAVQQARLALRRGRQDEAADHLLEAKETFARLGAQLELQRVQRLVYELEPREAA